MAVSLADTTNSNREGQDCLHVAVMQRMDTQRVWSYDVGFDAVPSLQRVA